MKKSNSERIIEIADELYELMKNEKDKKLHRAMGNALGDLRAYILYPTECMD